MSYNITGIEVVRCKAHILARDVKDLYEQLEDDLPEINLLEDMIGEANAALLRFGEAALLPIEHISWSGESSGSLFAIFEREIAPKIQGKVKAVVCWEGGDSYTAFIIEDGKYEEAEVKFKVVRVPE